MKKIRKIIVMTLVIAVLISLSRGNVNTREYRDVRAADANGDAGNQSTSMVDIRGEFNISGVLKQRHKGYSKDGADEMLMPTNGERTARFNGKERKYKYYNIDPSNSITLGDAEDILYERQTVTLTSKYSIDFKRSFELIGAVNMSDLPDGFAVAFHSNKDYVAKNAGGSLGVYKQEAIRDNDNFNKLTDFFANSDGVPNGVVMEIDRYSNEFDVKTNKYPFGDTENSGSSNEMAINETNESGVVVTETTRTQLYDDGIKSLLGKDTNFDISWDGIDKFTYKFGNYTLTKQVSSKKAEMLKNSDYYFSISTTLALNNPEGVANPQKYTKITLSEFKYTDYEPVITTEAIMNNGSFKIEADGKLNELEKYAIPGEEITIRHKLNNSKAISNELTDTLSISNVIQSDSSAFPAAETIDIIPDSIRVGYNSNQLTEYTGNAGWTRAAPIEVKVKHNETYYVEYKIKLRDYKKYGGLEYLHYNFLLGKKGMTQIPKSDIIPIKNSPKLYYSDNSGTIEKPLFMMKNITSTDMDNLKSALWQNLKAKLATDSTADNTRTLSSEVAEPATKDIKVSWEYYKDLSSANASGGSGTGPPFDPTNMTLTNNTISDVSTALTKGELYTVKVRVADKNDERLYNDFYSYVAVADVLDEGSHTITDTSGQSVIGSYNYIYANHLPDIAETKLVTLDIGGFLMYVIIESKATCIKINPSTGVAEFIKNTNNQINVDICNDWINDNGYVEKKPSPSPYTIKISVTNFSDNAKVEVNQRVIENVLSYDNPKVSEDEGLSGFIVIPRGVELKRKVENDKNILEGDAQVYFAYSDKSKTTKFDFMVDKKFDITNSELRSGNPGATLEVDTTVVSSSQNLTTGGKLMVGEINSKRGKNNPYKFKFKADKTDIPNVKGHWEGSVNFYFTRK